MGIDKTVQKEVCFLGFKSDFFLVCVLSGHVSKTFIKLSRGEICAANFIPLANGASLGSYFCVKNLTSA